MYVHVRVCICICNMYMSCTLVQSKCMVNIPRNIEAILLYVAVLFLGQMMSRKSNSNKMYHWDANQDKNSINKKMYEPSFLM